MASPAQACAGLFLPGSLTLLHPQAGVHFSICAQRRLGLEALCRAMHAVASGTSVWRAFAKPQRKKQPAICDSTKRQKDRSTFNENLMHWGAEGLPLPLELQWLNLAFLLALGSLSIHRFAWPSFWLWARLHKHSTTGVFLDRLKQHFTTVRTTFNENSTRIQRDSS